MDGKNTALISVDNLVLFQHNFVSHKDTKSTKKIQHINSFVALVALWETLLIKLYQWWPSKE
jgi:hypothetical protein